MQGRRDLADLRVRLERQLDARLFVLLKPVSLTLALFPDAEENF